MSEMIDLHHVERRAWRLYFQDGLWDIFLGLLFLGTGLRALTGNLWFYLLVRFLCTVPAVDEEALARAVDNGRP